MHRHDNTRRLCAVPPVGPARARSGCGLAAPGAAPAAAQIWAARTLLALEAG